MFITKNKLVQVIFGGKGIMKILLIISSKRKEGNTNNVLNLIEDEIKISLDKMSLTTEKIFLGDYNIQFCKGCRACFNKGEEKCPLKDDLLLIRDKILKSDIIIFGSPVYVEDINGVMKNWIDRMAFNNHRPAFAGKAAFLITTSGIGSSNHALKTMKKALTAWGFYVIGQNKFRTGSLMKIRDIEKKYKSKIKSIAYKIKRTIVDNKVNYPKFYSLVSFKVQQKYWQKNSDQKQHTFDYNYWLKKGWLDSKCKYYINNQANPIKVLFARVFGNLISVFFI